MTDDEIKAAAHVACCSLVYRIVEQLALPLQNLALELQGEKGPFKKGARTHAQTCTGIIISVKKLHNAKLKFRPFLGSSHEVDILLRHVSKLLTRLKARIFEPLRKASKCGTEKSTQQAILRVAKAADQLCVAANLDADRARTLLARANRIFAKLIPLLVPTPTAPGSKGSEVPLSPTLQTLPTRRCKMCVASIDMSEYGKIATMLEDLASVQTLFQFNQELQGFFREKVKFVRVDPNQVPSINTGDGALMFFLKAAQAVRFALELQKDAIANNRGVRDSNNKKRYRIGLCTGEVCLQETRTADGILVSFCVAGVAIAHAVRLQANCKTDQLLLDEQTYLDMNKKLRSQCGKIVNVKGKTHESWKIPARRCTP